IVGSVVLQLVDRFPTVARRFNDEPRLTDDGRQHDANRFVIVNDERAEGRHAPILRERRYQQKWADQDRQNNRYGNQDRGNDGSNRNQYREFDEHHNRNDRQKQEFDRQKYQFECHFHRQNREYEHRQRTERQEKECE
ncbi:MAG TPA: hypothetical protein VJ032_05385, partial [Thermoanaerobaculia bacterium]|nr:hypothetical protein [Thermoanaerobaculia bacterium]